MKEIELTQGRVALVDDVDYEYLKQWKWHTHRCGKNIYARRRLNKTSLVSMHYVIMNPPKGMTVDHINRYGLDNRRENLRVCTQAENSRNQQLRTMHKTSPFKGVCWNKFKNRWDARIKLNRKQILVGYFKDETEAAKAYDEAARRYHGKFASTNFVES